MDDENQYDRPNWDEYFTEIMEIVAKRGVWGQNKFGAVITKNNQVLTTGYVGFPAGANYKRADGPKNDSIQCEGVIHAEQNAVYQSAKNGVAIEGGTLYCHMTPCEVCAKMIINSGIKRVVCQKWSKNNERVERLFASVGVALLYLNEITPENKEKDLKPAEILHETPEEILDQIAAKDDEGLRPIVEDIENLDFYDKKPEVQNESESRW